MYARDKYAQIGLGGQRSLVQVVEDDEASERTAF
jgi:hypothetical protein